MFKNVRADMRHYVNAGGWFRHPGFWASATYRFGAWCHHLRFLPVRVLLLVVYKVIAFPWQAFKTVIIPARTSIGPGLCLHHPWNILMPPTVEIGKNCSIHHEVTFGRGPIPGTPTVGDNVTIFPGAKLLGGIRIGDGAEIGANVVVMRDVPPGAVVAAPPARIIPRETAGLFHGVRAESAVDRGDG